ncbi:HU family DNA-binding protein [Sedimentitalea sp.]|uniref:HU family DNA-binding protein n=1 Tax=Sedimentitalea sp. TaxID=2048915 RepID=UPI00329A2662
MTISSSTEAGDAVTEAAAEPEAASTEMKKKELVDLVVTRSGIKKKDAKPVVEAMLAVLGESIAEGREMNLQPFGKLRINRTVEKHNGRITVCKLRQSTNTASDTTALAETAQDG